MPRNVTRSAKEKTLDNVATQEGRDQVLRDFDRAVYSQGSGVVRDVQYKTWHEWHVAWFGNDDVLPLTPTK